MLLFSKLFVFLLSLCSGHTSFATSAEKPSFKDSFNNEAIEIDEDLCPKDNGPIGSTSYHQESNKPYYQSTSFDMVSYFDNLVEYQPYNSVGSCGYVSLISVMSYYDSFYNDNIVPDAYEFKDTTKTSEAAVKLVSPGTKREQYSSGNLSYEDFCYATMSDNLQSKLTILNNQNNSVFDGACGIGNYDNILVEFYDNSGIACEITEINGSSTPDFLGKIRTKISQGYPVIVEVKSYNSMGNENGFHSVVAYDYDDSNIYANFGWGYGYTHSQLLGGEINYLVIYSACTLDFSSNNHVHSDNYVVSGKGHCGCNLSDEVLFLNTTTYQNISPTIYWMRDIYNPYETYDLALRIFYDDEYNFIFLDHVSFNQYTISDQDWAFFLYYYEDSKGYFELIRHNGNTSYAPQRTYFQNGFGNCISFLKHPYTYSFPDAYCSTPVTTIDGVYDIDYTINRLRCGYIHNEFVVLSPRRSGAGTAYIEFVFNDPIYKIEIDISFWSDSELTDYTNATGYIQFRDYSNNYHDVLDLYNDIELSCSRTAMNHLIITFPGQTNCFRIYTTAEAIGNKNKGRIAIGDLIVYGENLFIY